MKFNLALMAAAGAVALGAPSLANATITFGYEYMSAPTYEFSAHGNHTDSPDGYMSADGGVHTVGGTHTYTDTVTSTVFVPPPPHNTTTTEDTGEFGSSTGAVIDPLSSGSYFFDQSLNFSNLDASNYVYGAAYGDFEYGFSSDAAFTLTINYTTTGSTACVSCTTNTAPTFLTRVYNSDFSFFQSFVTSVNDAGTVAYVNLAPGTYVLQTFNSDDAYAALYTTGTAAANGTGAFNFEITSPTSGTPEPGVWAMMMLGLFGTGGMLRMRSRMRTVAA
jgi:hypothetical protein